MRELVKSLQRLYLKGEINIERLQNALEKEIITQDEFSIIVEDK